MKIFSARMIRSREYVILQWNQHRFMIYQIYLRNAAVEFPFAADLLCCVFQNADVLTWAEHKISIDFQSKVKFFQRLSLQHGVDVDKHVTAYNQIQMTKGRIF